jgi:hypothetical protein
VILQLFYFHIVERAIELLILLQTKQSAEDGVNRPHPLEFDRSKEIDNFSLDIQEVITYLLLSKENNKSIDRLTQIGKKLIESNKVNENFDVKLSEVALDYIEKEYESLLLNNVS